MHLLSASEMIVVYREVGSKKTTKAIESGDNSESEYEMANRTNNGSGQKEIVRCIIEGPCVYMTQVNEWLHKFSWHGSKPESKAHYTAGTRKFETLSKTPESMYYNVRDVRTSDDAILSIKLMLFYHCTDIHKMLDTTQDPIGEFLNSVCADIITFASTRDYETLIEESSQLNDMGKYPQLVARSKEIGMCVSKVVYRGHHASEEIERAHVSATSRRTEMRVKADMAKEEQEMIDMRLRAQQQREDAERDMSMRQAQHKLDLERKTYEAEIARTERVREAELSYIASQRQAEIDFEQQKSEARIAGLTKMRDLGVDLTRYLVADSERPDKHIRFSSADGEQTAPVVHYNM